MQTTQKEECELKRVRMASIRRRLGLERGGARALGVLAALSGSGEGDEAAAWQLDWVVASGLAFALLAHADGAGWGAGDGGA